MSEELVYVAKRICPSCQAEMEPTASTCWLCKVKEPNPYSFQSAVLSQAAERPIEGKLSTWDVIASVILLCCFGLTILIAIGIGVDSPGSLIPFFIVVGPTYLVTIVRGMLQYNKPSGVKPTSVLLTFLISALITFGIIVGLLVAAVVLIFLTCLRSTQSGGFGPH